MGNFKHLISTTLLTSLAILLTGCVSEYSFTSISSPIAQDVNAGPSDSSGNITQVFRTLQPAVAVRGGSCLACHASIQSNIVTDFGYGDPFFLDKGLDADNYDSFYFNHGLNTWQTASINGSMIIPKVSLNRANFVSQLGTVDPTGSKGSMSLAQLLQLPNIADMDGNTLSTPNNSMASGVTPVAGAQAVIEKTSIYIGAPTVSDIQAILPAQLVQNPKSGNSATFNELATTLTAQHPLSGLTISGSGSSSYVYNNGTFVCYGDVVVQGTLFLNAPIIQTDDDGCRLYVTGTVFLQGQIVYQGATPNSKNNLQITSASAIMVGFDTSTLPRRLMLSGDRVSALPGSFTRGNLTTAAIAAKHQGILNEALNISGLVDAETLPTTVANGTVFTHLLLNAPEVHSHYASSFNGAVIAEIILFRLQQFSFTFDSLFTSVPVLPALKVDILKIVD